MTWRKQKSSCRQSSVFLGRDWLPDSTLGQAPEIQAHLFGCVFLPPGLALPMQTLAAILALPMRANRPFLRMQAGGVQRGDAGASARVSAGDGGRWRESCGYLPPSRRDRCYIPPPPSPSSARPALLSPPVTGAEFLPSSPYFFFFVQIRGGFVLCRFGASFFVLFRDLGFLIPF